MWFYDELSGALFSAPDEYVVDTDFDQQHPNLIPFFAELTTEGV